MSHISSPASILWSRLHLLSLVPHFLYLGSYISCLCLTSPVSVSHLLSPYHIFCLRITSPVSVSHLLSPYHISCLLSHISCILGLTYPVSVPHILSLSHISCLCLTSPVSVSHLLSLISHILSSVSHLLSVAHTFPFLDSLPLSKDCQELFQWMPLNWYSMLLDHCSSCIFPQYLSLLTFSSAKLFQSLEWYSFIANRPPKWSNRNPSRGILKVFLSIET